MKEQEPLQILIQFVKQKNRPIARRGIGSIGRFCRQFPKKWLMRELVTL
jgi:hypothetical protein